MLILRRRPGESLLIGSDVEIEILEVAGSAVKIGIRAPKGITILRKELELTRTQNCAAARDVPMSTLAESFPRIHRSHNSLPPR
ncbi:MAG TPA: carbon storage regulator [Bryobacteraceae bacterium]|nr:carbon storage regulator [Bryobacteraceae bacterium]